MMRRDLPPGAQRLVREDGAVVVPASVAGAVLRRLMRDLSREVQADGGSLSPAVHTLMWALHGAAKAEAEEAAADVRSAPGTPVVEAAIVEISTAEAAHRMGCSVSYARRLARSGQVPARKVGAVWLIRQAAGAALDDKEQAA